MISLDASTHESYYLFQRFFSFSQESGEHNSLLRNVAKAKKCDTQLGKNYSINQMNAFTLDLLNIGLLPQFPPGHFSVLVLECSSELFSFLSAFSGLSNGFSLVHQ